MSSRTLDDRGRVSYAVVVVVVVVVWRRRAGAERSVEIRESEDEERSTGLGRPQRNVSAGNTFRAWRGERASVAWRAV